MNQLLTKHKTLISFLLSCFCTYFLSIGYIITPNPLIKSNSFSALIYLTAFTALFNHVVRNAKKRMLLSALPAGFILACCVRIGAEFAAAQTLDYASVYLYWSVLALTFVLTACITVTFEFLPILTSKMNRSRFTRFLNRIFEHRRSYYILWGLILLCWIPAFLAVFPGIYSYDASPQVAQLFISHRLDAHHPVIHTLMLDGCLYLGHAVTGDYNTGLALYSAVQALFIASVFAYALDKMKRYNVPLIVRLISFLFLAVSPINQILVFTTTKDTMFAGFFLLLFIRIIDITADPKEFFSSRKNMGFYVLIVVFMCLFRNQGIYVFFLCVPFMIIALKNYRKKVLLVSLIPIILVKILTGPVSAALDIKEPKSREALSVPIQQLARTLRYNPDSVDDATKNIIYQYVPEEYLNKYHNLTSDPVKEGFNDKLFKKDSLSFFKAWAQVGLINPQLYIEAFLYGSYGYFYPDTTQFWINFILFDGIYLDDDNNILKIERNSLLPGYEDYLRSVAIDMSLEDIPVISFILNEAFPFWLMVFAASFLLYKRRYKAMMPLLFIGGFWGTNLLGPVIVIRYVFPIIVCVPTMAGLIFSETQLKK